MTKAELIEENQRIRDAHHDACMLADGWEQRAERVREKDWKQQAIAECLQEASNELANIRRILHRMAYIKGEACVQLRADALSAHDRLNIIETRADGLLNNHETN